MELACTAAVKRCERGHHFWREAFTWEHGLLVNLLVSDVYALRAHVLDIGDRRPLQTVRSRRFWSQDRQIDVVLIFGYHLLTTDSSFINSESIFLSKNANYSKYEQLKEIREMIENEVAKISFSRDEQITKPSSSFNFNILH